LGRGGGRLRGGNGAALVAARRGLSLSIKGGGSTPPFRPIDELFGCLVSEEPYVAIGGLFMVCVRAGAAGRSVGTGGGGLLPKV
jgi:hypothetical protein